MADHHAPLFNPEDKLTPVEIVQHNFLTRNEKIERLNELKAEVTGARENEDAVAFSSEEIDRAIAGVKQEIQDDDEVKTVISDQVAGR